MSLVEVHRLHLRFRGAAAHAVRDVSLSIGAGETVALVGESGSGKTMTAMTVARLAPEDGLETFDGEVHVDGTDVLEATPETLRHLRRGKIGVVFQDPTASLNPIMTVGRQIREALLDPARLSPLLAEVGLADIPNVAQRFPHELSGGQQQRVAIAMALAADPAVLIADEPTTALDVTVQAQILALFAELKANRGMALLFISHDFGVVAQLADRILVMRHGEIVEEGPAHALLAHPSQTYTKGLLACRPTLARAPARLATLDGTPDPLPRPDLGAQLLTAHGLKITYPPRGVFGSDFTAAQRVDLELRRGEALGLVGESGSGKSSVAKALVGLAPISAGQVTLDGAPFVPEEMPAAARKRLQYIFQDNYGSLNPRHSVARLVREGLDLHDIGQRSDRRTAVIALLNEVGLGPEFLDRVPRELSGGQRQRVAIARALALEPDLLICDEIVSALDVSVQAQILNLLKDLMAQRGLAVLFISHDLAVVRFLADRIIVMHRGQLVETAIADALINAPKADHTKDLIAASRAIDLAAPSSGLSA